jgi:hypothetical protein
MPRNIEQFESVGKAGLIDPIGGRFNEERQEH